MKYETGPLPGQGVNVTYQGRVSNHFIVSPSRRIRHYGYGAKGKKLYVFLEDARLAPDLFVLDNLEDEERVWPKDPQNGSPPERTIEVAAEEEDEPDAQDQETDGEVADEKPQVATAPVRPKSAAKPVVKRRRKTGKRA